MQQRRARCHADTTVIDYTMAVAFAGQRHRRRSLQDVFNSKAVTLGFRKAAQRDAFLVRIMQPSWMNFAQRPDTLFARPTNSGHRHDQLVSGRSRHVRDRPGPDQGSRPQ